MWQKRKPDAELLDEKGIKLAAPSSGGMSSRMLMSDHFDAPKSLQVALNFFFKHNHIII